MKDPHLYLIFELLLKTGLREHEALFLNWQNIDSTAGILKVRSKPERDFRIKDKDERNVPTPSELLNALKAYRMKHFAAQLATGTRTYQPNQKRL
jgi:integrase